MAVGVGVWTIQLRLDGHKPLASLKRASDVFDCTHNLSTLAITHDTNFGQENRGAFLVQHAALRPSFNRLLLELQLVFQGIPLWKAETGALALLFEGLQLFI